MTLFSFGHSFGYYLTLTLQQEQKMFTSVALDHVRNFRRETIDLDQFTIFVGPNGCGKSTILEMINLASRISADQVDVVLANSFRPSAFLSRRTGGESTSGSLSASTALGKQRGSIDLEFRPVHAPKQSDERWGYRLRAAWGKDHIETSNMTIKLSERFPTFLEGFGHSTYLRLDPRNIALSTWSNERFPSLSPDGVGLAPVLADMRVSSPEHFEALLNELCSIVPQLKGIRLVRDQVTRVEKRSDRADADYWYLTSEKVYGYRVLLDYDHVSGVPLEDVSQGTLLALGLLAVLHSQDTAEVLLLDDLERALHPVAQAKIVEVLHAILRADPRRQIIATTHSPFTLESANASSIRVMNILADGSTKVLRLSDFQDYERWSKVMTPGEIWASAWEKWVVRKAGSDADG